MALTVRPSCNPPMPSSPLARTLDIIDAAFRRCGGSACIPQRGLPLVTYLGADSSPDPLPRAAARSEAHAVNSDSARPQQGDPRAPPNLPHQHSSADNTASAPLPAPHAASGRQPAVQPMAGSGLARTQLAKADFDLLREEAQPARQAIRAAELLGLRLYRTSRWDAEAERIYTSGEH